MLKKAHIRGFAMKRTFIMILSGIIVLLAVAGIFFFMQVDSMAKRALEKYGSAVFGARLTVASVNISTQSGEGSLKDLTIANPQGFGEGHAFMMPETKIKVESKSLATDVIVIDEIVMDSPDIVYEVTASGNNYAVLRKNVNDYLSKDEGKGDSLIDSKQVIVKDFYLRNGKVKVIAPSLPGKTFTVSLPTIHLSDLGKDQGKGNLPKVIQQVSTVITNSVVSAVGNVTLDNFLKFLPNTVTGVAHGVLNDTGTAIQNVGEGIGEVFAPGK
jgi:hypothetical protein